MGQKASCLTFSTLAYPRREFYNDRSTGRPGWKGVKVMLTKVGVIGVVKKSSLRNTELGYYRVAK